MFKKEQYVIGVDIGGTHISSALVSLQRKEILRETYASNYVANMEPQEVILQNWADTLNTSIKAAGKKPIQGIAFAMPGPFDYRQGIALYPEDFKYGALNGILIQKALEPILVKSLPMRFLNDATSFAVGEAWLCEKKLDKQLCITLGTGFGAGFTNKGIPVVKSDTVPPEGCLWNLPYGEGIADDYFSTRGFINTYQDLTGEEISGVKDLANSYKTNVMAREIFDSFGESLGEFLIPWLKKFDAKALVIGGNIAKAFTYFENTLCKTIKTNGLSTLSIRISEDSEKGAILGSSLLYDKHFWRKIKNELPAY